MYGLVFCQFPGPMCGPLYGLWRGLAPGQVSGLVPYLFPGLIPGQFPGLIPGQSPYSGPSGLWFYFLRVPCRSYSLAAQARASTACLGGS